jgi:hypothetical protein
MTAPSSSHLADLADLEGAEGTVGCSLDSSLTGVTALKDDEQ